MRRTATQWLRQEGGAAAAEFAMVFPIFALIVLGLFQVMTMVYSTSSIHWAAEQAARCAVISKSYSTAPVGDPSLGCQTRSSTQSYAVAIYKGPQISPTFVASEDSNCSGRKVLGTGTYRFRAGPVSIDVPLSAKACFPAYIDPTAPWT